MFFIDELLNYLLCLINFSFLLLALVHKECAAQHNLNLIIRLLQYCRQLYANLVRQPLQFWIPLFYYLDELVDFLLKRIQCFAHQNPLLYQTKHIIYRVYLYFGRGYLLVSALFPDQSLNDSILFCARSRIPIFIIKLLIRRLLGHSSSLLCKQLFDFSLGDDSELVNNLVNVTLIFCALNTVNVARLASLRINLEAVCEQISAHFFNFTHHVIINEIIVQIVELLIKILFDFNLGGLDCKSLFCFFLFCGLCLVTSVVLNWRERVVELEPCDH